MKTSSEWISGSQPVRDSFLVLLFFQDADFCPRIQVGWKQRLLRGPTRLPVLGINSTTSFHCRFVPARKPRPLGSILTTDGQGDSVVNGRSGVHAPRNFCRASEGIVSKSSNVRKSIVLN